MQVRAYVARSSFISAATSPIESAEPKLPSAWQRRMVLDDVSSRSFQRLIDAEAHSELLLIDLVDERLGVLEVGDNQYVTNSAEFKASGIAERLPSRRQINFGSEEHFALWLVGALSLAEQLTERNAINKALLIETWFAESDAKGVPIPPFWGISATTWNQNYQRYFAAMRELGFATYRLPETVRSDPNHRWGPAHYHYEESVYRDVVAAGRAHAAPTS